MLVEPVTIVASSEFTLKSAPVRRSLEQRLIDDLRSTLRKNGFKDIRVEKHAGRIIVHGLDDPERAARLCARVFGVAYAAPASMVPGSIDDVLARSVQLADQALGVGSSFAIRAHRSTAGSLSGREVEIRAGSEILGKLRDRRVRVDLTRPDVTIYVDLADERAYLYSDRVQGPGGLPLSSQWRMLAILDSGHVSSLAAYSMMRRGCLVEFLVPISQRFEPFSEESQLQMARKIRSLVPRDRCRTFTANIDTILEARPEMQDSNINLLKSFIRIAALDFAKQRKFNAIVLADASGNIGNLQIDRHHTVPVFYPLIGLTRNELVEMAQLAGLPEVELLNGEADAHESSNELATFPENSVQEVGS
jgi:thiamine biosynthesis protein ThiI